MVLTTDLSRGGEVPYFLWDEPLTVDELRARLADGSPLDERLRLAGKVLREARFDEAMALVPLDFVVSRYDELRRHLGRRCAFWDYLLREWRDLGLIG